MINSQKDIKQLKTSEIADLRNKILDEQDGKCAICGTEINETTGYSLDHQHRLKSHENIIDGAGLIRGVLCRACNVFEGKIWNNTQRYMQPKNLNDRIDILESIISYYKKPNYPFIHPSEQKKEPKISKRNYNKLLKVYNGKRKFPEYPKTGKLTLGLKILFEEYKIEPYN